MKDLSKRFSSGLIGLILLIIVVKKGGNILALSILLISLIGIREFYKALHNINIFPIKSIGYLATIFLFLSAIYPVITLELVITGLTIITLVLIISKKNIDLGGVSLTIFGVLYIPFLLFHIYFLDKGDYIWLIFIIAFGTDTFAYIAGNLFGRHKLCPKISPKKTIEGSIGGILGSIVLTILYSIYIGIDISWHLILLSIIVSIMSQLGDLAASKIKRMAGIKDYGFIMPGHGGVLDRFDSIIICAPLIYYYVHYFIN